MKANIASHHLAKKDLCCQAGPPLWLLMNIHESSGQSTPECNEALLVNCRPISIVEGRLFLKVF